MVEKNRKPILDIKDLKIEYNTYAGRSKVINELNMHVYPGEKIGLVGESGCGKTTTMRSILKVLPKQGFITGGEIIYKDENIFNMKKKQIQNLRGKEISMIFQDPTASLNPVFKIGTQIKDTIKYSLESNQRNKSKKIIYKKSIEALKDCSLPDPERIMDNYPFQLSGGMRQRICIAMALATAEDFLIADEPTTNLDVTIQSQVLDLIKKLVEEKNTTLILITHSLGVAREMTDRIYVMYAGEIVESAKTKDIFNKAYHPYTVGLLNAVPKLSGDKKLEGIDGRITSYLNPPNGCRYAPRCDNAKLICHDEKPTFKKVGDEHYIACHLVEKNAGEKNE